MPCHHACRVPVGLPSCKQINENMATVFMLSDFLFVCLFVFVLFCF